MDKKGRWVTVRGRAIFIEEGQNLEEAMESSGKFDINEKKIPRSIKISRQEFAEVTSAINNDSDKQRRGKAGQKIMLKWYGNYVYTFAYNEFNDYVIVRKAKIK